MKLLVDKMPTWSGECIFKEYMSECRLKKASCDMERGESCQYLSAEQTELNSSEIPNNCEELNAYRKCVESRSFWDNKHCDWCYFDERCPFDEPKDEPQAGEMMTEEEFDSMLARVLTGKNEPQIEREGE